MKSVIILVAIAAMSLQPATTTVAGNPLNESSNLNGSVLTPPDSTSPLTLQYAAPQPGMFFLIGGGLLSVSAVLRRRRKN
jgi:hypothetical protein